MQKLIYVIEDDENIRELVKIALEGYNYEVKAFETAENALEKIKERIPDLAIFDIMLPGMSGIDAVKIIREDNKLKIIPIIMLTAKDSEVDKIVGLDVGADDYMTKPFSIMELMARIRSMLRRSEIDFEHSGTNKKNDTFNQLEIDYATREVKVCGELVTLTFKEYELLKFLIENKDKVVSRSEVLNKVWGYEYTGETRTVDIHIRTLRQKLGIAGDYIKTSRGMGYRFNEN